MKNALFRPIVQKEPVAKRRATKTSQRRQGSQAIVRTTVLTETTVLIEVVTAQRMGG